MVNVSGDKPGDEAPFTAENARDLWLQLLDYRTASTTEGYGVPKYILNNLAAAAVATEFTSEDVASMLAAWAMPQSLFQAQVAAILEDRLREL